ncbi:nuclear transport factor 2 family protein [Sphingobium sp.]|uniref:nuclear transport factor 2 family protein n=1 Tax=Sphingobium sp. TaxID=1912891 RepID=UPI002C6A4FED|nr:nuclear transport factor 2 family protein [Sphingobium sp.]HUD93995.1 nuclear transport factor 2 family protein [Sphingobium sp.]
MDASWSAERLSDRLQIQEVLHRYCAAIDRIQPDALMANVFHADATIDKSGAPVAVATFVAVAARHSGVPSTSHMMSNFFIDFFDHDSAFMESWCLALERHPSSGPENRTVDRIYRVRYGDRFERRSDGRWRIGARTFVLDHVLSVATDFTLDQPDEGHFRGQRDAGDPIIRMRVRLGLPPA